MIDSLDRQAWPERGQPFDMMKMSICPTYFFDFPKFYPNDDLLHRVENGQRIPRKLIDDEKIFGKPYAWVFSSNNFLRGLVELTDNILYKSYFPKINENI